MTISCIIPTCDRPVFLKEAAKYLIDKKVAEPLLYDSLKGIINNIRAIIIEVGDNISHEKIFTFS